MSIKRCPQCELLFAETEVTDGFCLSCGMSFDPVAEDDVPPKPTESKSTFPFFVFSLGMFAGMLIGCVGMAAFHSLSPTPAANEIDSLKKELVLAEENAVARERAARAAVKKATARLKNEKENVKVAEEKLAKLNNELTALKKQLDNANAKTGSANKQLKPSNKQLPPSLKKEDVAKKPKQNVPGPPALGKPPIPQVKPNLPLLKVVNIPDNIKEFAERSPQSLQRFRTASQALINRTVSGTWRYTNLYREKEEMARMVGRIAGLKVFKEHAHQIHRSYNADHANKGKRLFEKEPQIKNAERHWTREQKRRQSQIRSHRRQIQQERNKRDQYIRKLRTTTKQDVAPIVAFLEKLAKEVLAALSTLPKIQRANPDFAAKYNELSAQDKRRQQLLASLQKKLQHYVKHTDVVLVKLAAFEKTQQSFDAIAHDLGFHRGRSEGATKYQNQWIRIFGKIDQATTRLASDGDRQKNKEGYRKFIEKVIVQTANKALAKSKQLQKKMQAQVNLEKTQLQKLANELNQTAGTMDQEFRDLASTYLRIDELQQELNRIRPTVR